ncbi:hypothetical protein [Anoxynatronum buryatiense]|uniref:histidine kinase n=1 Tax=Anoxynatronum buryatiense TaxID=489973 RepID=A0AA46AIJ1_9CLOT|nr:hypothetical protein [Anoxynatronum buryatiense]SMP51389.1 hypothetical protein SAMN06296020_10492 [Anoxynatronum buryatiense]
MIWLIPMLTLTCLASFIGVVFFHKLFSAATPFWPGMLLRIGFSVLHLFFLLEMLQHRFSMPATPLAPATILPQISTFLALGILFLYAYYLFWMKTSPQAAAPVYAQTLWWGALMIVPGALYALLTWLRHPTVINSGVITLQAAALTGLVSAGFEAGLFLLSLAPYIKQHFTPLALRQLIDRLYQPVAVTDSRDRVVMVNPAFEKLARQLHTTSSDDHWPLFLDRLTTQPSGSFHVHTQPLASFSSSSHVHVIQDLRSFVSRAHQLEQLNEELSHSNRILKDLMNRRFDIARNQERQMMVQQIHDRLGQCIGFVAAAADTALQEMPHDLDKGTRRMEKALEMLLTFDEETLNTPMPQHFCQELTTLAAIYREIGINVHLSQLPELLPAPICHALTEVCREAFINAVCHGAAHQLEVTCEQTGKFLHFMIQDDGHSTTPLEEGMGISGMRRRIHQLKGQLILKPSAQGFTVKVTLPLESAPTASPSPSPDHQTAVGRQAAFEDERSHAHDSRCDR